MPLNFDVLDCHCDTLTSLHNQKKHLKYSDMRRYRRYIQVFAICSEYNNFPYLFAKRYTDKFKRVMRRENIDIVLSADMLKNTHCGAILALEGADCLHSNLAMLRHFYKEGVRLLTVTWNRENGAASNVLSKTDGGLTAFGKELVSECEKLGIVVDLSHISDKGFWDVCEIATKPFICSHSNSRAVNPLFNRNITDDQFKALMSHGGVVGINFCPDFIGGDVEANDIIRHIEHFCSLGGEKNIGIGSDFDGIPNLPKGCKGAGFMYELAQRMLSLNYNEETVRGILFDNFYNLFEGII